MSDKKTAGKRSRWVTMLLGLAVAGLASAALAGRLGRCWWVADLLAHFAVYYTLAGAGLCIVAALFRRWVSSGLALSVLLINGVLIWPVFAPVTTTAPGGPVVLRLALMNVLHKNRDRGRVVGFIRNCEADLIFVQEVDPWWDGVLREMDTPYRVAVSRPGGGSFGIAMLVREEADGEVELEGTRVLDLAAETDGAQRPAIEASLLLGGRRVMLLTVHPPPPVSAELTALRDSILSRAKDWANEQTNPHIVIGDLNTTPWSYAFSILTGDGQLLSTLNGRGNQGSWPANLPMPWLLPIDHCLLSRGLVCRDRRVGPDIGSDHLPLTVSLSLISGDKYQAGRSIPSYPDAPDSPHQNITEFEYVHLFY